jgi:hypothetical protein
MKEQLFCFWKSWNDNYYLRYLNLFLIGFILIIAFFLEWIFLLINNPINFSILLLIISIFGFFYSKQGNLTEIVFIPMWVLGILFAILILIFFQTSIPDLILPVVLVFVIGLYGLLYILISIKLIFETYYFENYPQWYSSRPHTGIIVVHYDHQFVDYSIWGVKTLITGLYQIRKPHTIRGLFRVEPYKIYHCSKKDEIIKVIDNPNILRIWVFGHGVKHGIKANDGMLYYCELSEAPKKEFIAQLHCNPLGGKSLIDFLLLKSKTRNYIINDDYRNYTMNLTSIKEYLRLKSINQE